MGIYNDNSKIKILSRYLITKGVDEAAKIQKMLFCFRYEELLNNLTDQTYFNDDHNFQAWIYGPVNVESYYYLRPLWYGDEIESYLLSEQELKEVDQKYGKWFAKWNQYSTSELINISHTNQAYINARKGFQEMQPCANPLEEKSNSFLKMEIIK